MSQMMKKRVPTKLPKPLPPRTCSSHSSLPVSPASVLPQNPNPKKRSCPRNQREESEPMKKKKNKTEMGPNATAPLSPSSLRVAALRLRFADTIYRNSGKSKEEIERRKKKDEMLLAEAKRLEERRQDEMRDEEMKQRNEQRAKERLMRERMEAEAAVLYKPMCCSLKEIGVVRRCVEAQAWVSVEQKMMLKMERLYN